MSRVSHDEQRLEEIREFRRAKNRARRLREPQAKRTHRNLLKKRRKAKAASSLKIT